MPGPRGHPMAIFATGLVTSAGLSAPAACAALRANIANPTTTRFVDGNGDWILAHEVPLEEPWRGAEKLARMAWMAIQEVLASTQTEERTRIPILLCISEPQRPGRPQDIDTGLLDRIQDLAGFRFAAGSSVLPNGRAGTTLAFTLARQLLARERVARVVICATDSLLMAGTLAHYSDRHRLLTRDNADGFIPGEGAGALLVGPVEESARVVCEGVGFALEPASVDTDQPLRADGLVNAIRIALDESGNGLHDMRFRVSDLSGEQYYFKEATLALSRILRVRVPELTIWHPAECFGETGAAAGVAAIAAVFAAFRNGYAPGSPCLAHFSGDDGRRSALVLRDVEAT